MLKKLLTASVFAALFATASNAAVVFEDDFSSYGGFSALDASSAFFGDWTVTGGTVDYLVTGSLYGDLCGGSGSCIDLDGSTGTPGLFSTSTVFAAGSYVLDLELFGSGRSLSPSDSVTVTLGNWSIVIGPIGYSENASGSWAFTTTGGALTFLNDGGDYMGAILKSVSLSSLPAVPLPAGLPLLAGGLGALGFMARRRKKTIA